MAVRSKYIKSLMDTKNSLDKQYQEVIAESMKNIIGENAKEEVRRLLKEAEDEDSFSEEEVDDDTATTDKEEIVDTDSEVEDGSEDNADDAVDTDTEEVEDMESSEADPNEEEADDDLWNDLEQCKDADGEYDCRGMDDGKLLKVLKAMGPEDGIRVMSNGDGTVNVEVDGDLIDGEQEFVIDIDDFSGDENDVELSVEDSLDEGKVDLGYMDHPGNGGYQKDTAVTLDPDESLPTDRKKVGHTWNPQLKDASIDHGKDGDRQPFNKNVNEEVDECGTIFEIEQDGDEEMIDEVMTCAENTPVSRGSSMTHQNSNLKGGKTNFRNGRTGEKGQVKGTGYNSYSGETNESVSLKKMVNRLYEENKQMKSIVPELTKKLNESMVINASMGYIVRLLNENSTTMDEKKQISERFTKVNTLEEGKKLYETISNELKNVNKRNDVNGIINSQLAEGKQAKQNLVETTMYKSQQVNETLNFMKRLDAVK